MCAKREDHGLLNIYYPIARVWAKRVAVASKRTANSLFECAARCRARGWDEGHLERFTIPFLAVINLFPECFPTYMRGIFKKVRDNIHISDHSGRRALING
jgi:DNA primase large subunit